MPSKRPIRTPDPEPDDGDEDEVPAPTKAAKRPAPPPPPRDDDEEDEDDKPRIRGGYTDAQRQMESTSNWAQSFKPDENLQFIKFLEDQPYANFKRHWIERPRRPQGRNVRAYTCLATFPGKTCPLCKIGEKPQAVVGLQHRHRR